jgi:hypothetical protein
MVINKTAANIVIFNIDFVTIIYLNSAFKISAARSASARRRRVEYSSRIPVRNPLSNQPAASRIRLQV